MARAKKTGLHERLREREDDYDEANASKDREQPEDPPPVYACDSHKTGHQRAEGRSREGSEGEVRQCLTTRASIPNVRNESATVGERGCREGTAEETEYQDGRGIARKRAADLESGVEEETDNEHVPPAYLLRQRAPEERTDAVSRDEQRNGQDRDFLAEAEVPDELLFDT